MYSICYPSLFLICLPLFLFNPLSSNILSSSLISHLFYYLDSYFSYCSNLSFKHEFIFMSPTPIHHYIEHSSFLPLFIFIHLLQCKHRTKTDCSLIFIVLHYNYTCITVLESLICISM